MINLQPIEWAKLAAILAVLAYGWYIWDSRADYRAEADALKVQVSLYQAKEAAAVADAERWARGEMTIGARERGAVGWPTMRAQGLTRHAP